MPARLSRASSADRSATERSPASRTTVTRSPRSVAVPTPRWTRSCTRISGTSSTKDALRSGLSPSARTRRAHMSENGVTTGSPPDRVSRSFEHRADGTEPLAVDDHAAGGVRDVQARLRDPLRDPGPYAPHGDRVLGRRVVAARRRPRRRRGSRCPAAPSPARAPRGPPRGASRGGAPAAWPAGASDRPGTAAGGSCRRRRRGRSPRGWAPGATRRCPAPRRRRRCSDRCGPGAHPRRSCRPRRRRAR